MDTKLTGSAAQLGPFLARALPGISAVAYIVDGSSNVTEFVAIGSGPPSSWHCALSTPISLADFVTMIQLSNAPFSSAYAYEVSAIT